MWNLLTLVTNYLDTYKYYCFFLICNTSIIPIDSTFHSENCYQPHERLGEGQKNELLEWVEEKGKALNAE